MISKRIWDLVSEETKTKIKDLVVKDLNALVGDELGYSLVQRSDTFKLKTPTDSPASSPKTGSDRGRPKGVLVFGRKFKSRVACAEHFEIPLATFHSWFRYGHDIEEKLKERSPKFQKATASNTPGTIIKSVDSEGNKQYRLTSHH